MTVTERVLSIAVFNCGYTCPSILAKRGQYHDIFRALLQPAADRISAKSSSPSAPRLKLDVSGWNTVNGEYPPTLDAIDAIIISGSPNGAYQDLEWIRVLNKYISYVYHHHPSIKLYGSCFGHQILCQALFADRGAIVEKDPAGWELGVQPVSLSDTFSARMSSILALDKTKTTTTLRLQFLHGDHVILPDGSLPDDVRIVGSTPACANQGVYQPGRLLTLQGHPEFDRFIETECLKLVAKRVGWEDGFLASALEAAGGEDDAGIAAEVIVAFFLE